MINFERVKKNEVSFQIDTQLFNDAVITKSLYWLGNDYIIYQKNSGRIRNVTIEKKTKEFSDSDLIDLKSTINQNLIDFKTRDIVNQETKNIREILLVKAFANNDDFDDHNLLADESTGR